MIDYDLYRYPENHGGFGFVLIVFLLLGLVPMLVSWVSAALESLLAVL